MKFAQLALNTGEKTLRKVRQSDLWKLTASYWRERLWMPYSHRHEPMAWACDMEVITDCDKEQHKELVERMQNLVESKGYGDAAYREALDKLGEYLCSVVQSELHDRMARDFVWAVGDENQEISEDALEDYRYRYADHKATA